MVLWFDMIYIQLVVCFLSPRQGSGIENTQLVGYKSYQTTNHGRSYTYSTWQFVLCDIYLSNSLYCMTFLHLPVCALWQYPFCSSTEFGTSLRSTDSERWGYSDGPEFSHRGRETLRPHASPSPGVCEELNTECFTISNTAKSFISHQHDLSKIGAILFTPCIDLGSP